MFQDDKIYSLWDIESKMKVSRGTVYNWIREGVTREIHKDGQVFKTKVKLQAIKAGRVWRVLGKNINDFLSTR